MNTRIYIAGPITGIPGENREAFYGAQLFLEERGWLVVVNPHEIGVSVREKCTDSEVEACGQDYMDACIEALISCDSICLLDGWKESAGASLEAAIAKVYGLTFYDKNGWPSEAPAEIVIKKGYRPRR